MRRLALTLILASFVLPVRPAGAQTVDTGLKPDTVLTLDNPPLATFVDARALAADPAGLLYVVDAGVGAVHILSADGRAMRTLGGPGSREGQFDEPTDVDPTNGLMILVADAGNARIQRFSNELLHLGSLPVGSDFQEQQGGALRAPAGSGARASREADGYPVAVAAGQAGETYVIDAAQGAMLTWDAAARPVRSTGATGPGSEAMIEPVDVTVDDRGTVYVADRGRKAVLVYDRFGNYVRALGEGLLENVQSVSAARDRLWIVLPDQLVEYDAKGRLVRTVGVNVDEALIDVVIDGERRYVLTSRQLYVLPL